MRVRLPAPAPGIRRENREPADLRPLWGRFHRLSARKRTNLVPMKSVLLFYFGGEFMYKRSTSVTGKLGAVQPVAQAAALDKSKDPEQVEVK